MCSEYIQAVRWTDDVADSVSEVASISGSLGAASSPSCGAPFTQRAIRAGMRLRALRAPHWAIRGTNGRAYQSAGPIVQILRYHDMSKVHIECINTGKNGFVSLVEGSYEILD